MQTLQSDLKILFVLSRRQEDTLLPQEMDPEVDILGTLRQS